MAIRTWEATTTVSRRRRSPATKAGRGRSRKLGEIRFKFVPPFPIQVAEDGRDGLARRQQPLHEARDAPEWEDDRGRLLRRRLPRGGRARARDGRRGPAGSPRLRR